LRYLALADNQLTYIREEMPIASLSSLTTLVRSAPLHLRFLPKGANA
jgi:hypothetical protein